MPVVLLQVGWIIFLLCCLGSGLPLGQILVYLRPTWSTARLCAFPVSFWFRRTLRRRPPRRSLSPNSGAPWPDSVPRQPLIIVVLATQRFIFLRSCSLRHLCMSGLTR